MEIDLDRLEVRNNPERNRFEAKIDEFTAIIKYQLTGDKIIFLHTRVPDEISGHGIGSKMAEAALNNARDAGLKVIPRCPFVADYISRHPEYGDLVVRSGWED